MPFSASRKRVNVLSRSTGRSPSTNRTLCDSTALARPELGEHVLLAGRRRQRVDVQPVDAKPEASACLGDLRERAVVALDGDHRQWAGRGPSLARSARTAPPEWRTGASTAACGAGTGWTVPARRASKPPLPADDAARARPASAGRKRVPPAWRFRRYASASACRPAPAQTSRDRQTPRTRARNAHRAGSHLPPRRRARPSSDRAPRPRTAEAARARTRRGRRTTRMRRAAGGG